jgi:alpha-glutamyl/putrescinyl thymine pyrophosphorylase clade 1
MKANGAIYKTVYVTPPQGLRRFGEPSKHRNHLRLLEWMMEQRIPARIERARSLEEVYKILYKVPSFGGSGFFAFQYTVDYTVDLNYSEMIDFSEMDFVAAGPGAQSGIRKCFESTGGLTDSDVIRAVAEMADREFERLGLRFQTLWGRRLQLIDYQNLFCEVDKYLRVVHPEIIGRGTQIKPFKKPNPAPLPQWYPPKWKLRLPSVCGGGDD